METAGANAMPIISIVSVLVGIVTILEASHPLARFGAQIYLADMIGFSSLRDTGPVVTAILLAGRSGAAFAAELGTNLNMLVTDLRGIITRLQTFVGQTNELARANLPVISADATNVLAGLKQTVNKLDRMATGVNESALNESLENIRRTTLELQQAIHKFREYPAGTLFGKPPPPAKSVEVPRGG